MRVRKVSADTRSESRRRRREMKASAHHANESGDLFFEDRIHVIDQVAQVERF